ncbi:MAG: hypothetical protein WD333_08510 [Dehalococcoidia bacterium]
MTEDPTPENEHGDYGGEDNDSMDLPVLLGRIGGFLVLLATAGFMFVIVRDARQDQYMTLLLANVIVPFALGALILIATEGVSRMGRRG